MYLTLKWVVVKSDNSVSFKDWLSKKIVLVHSFGSLATETSFESSNVVEHIKSHRRYLYMAERLKIYFTVLFSQQTDLRRFFSHVFYLIVVSFKEIINCISGLYFLKRSSATSHLEQLWATIPKIFDSLIGGFHYHAIENQNQNHVMTEAKNFRYNKIVIN